MSHRSAALLVAALALGTSVERTAAESGWQCPRRKLAAAAKLEVGALECHERATLRGLSVDPLCLETAETKFLERFAQADKRPPCFATDDTGAIDSAVGAFVDGMVGRLRPSQTRSTCATRKLKASERKASRKLTCHEGAVRAGTTVDVECLSKADTKFLDDFSRAELRPDCLETGDAADIEDAIDVFVADLAAALRPLTPSVCSKTKIGATADKGSGKLQCHAAAAKAGGPVDPGCLADEDANFAADFATAELRSDCYTTGDAAVIETGVDDVVDLFVSVLRPDLSPNGCVAKKLAVTGRGYELRLDCHVAAVRHGLPVDPTCLSAADEFVIQGFANAELSGGCQFTGTEMVTFITALTNGLVFHLGVPAALLP